VGDVAVGQDARLDGRLLGSDERLGRGAFLGGGVLVDVCKGRRGSEAAAAARA
jgi:hypothetical protein